jgi:hypothetical protein
MVVLVAGGCAGRRGLGSSQGYDVGNGSSHAKKASEYLQGFMDGYQSAHPERGYTADSRVYEPCNAYRSGRRSGYRTGANGERRRP